MCPQAGDNDSHLVLKQNFCNHHSIMRILFFMAFMLAPIIVWADDNFWDKKPHPNGFYGYDESMPDLLNIIGLTYHDARSVIIGAGWQPLQTLQPGTNDYEVETEYGEGKLFWEKEYHELQACSGGLTFCSFLFQNKKGDKLRVVTKGEEHEEYSHFARVTGYRFNP